VYISDLGSLTRAKNELGFGMSIQFIFIDMIHTQNFGFVSGEYAVGVRQASRRAETTANAVKRCGTNHPTTR